MGMTIAELTEAIRQHIDKEMEAEVASGMAEHALGFFGFYDRIIDNALEPTDRNLFYMFQDYDLLTTESEETTLWDGREWRIHYWRFKPELKENWEKLQGDTVKMMEFFNENIGDYPYKQYSVLQGGDGGMEYAMCTLITGERSYNSLFGVTAHELAHSWFHHLLATNESKHAWVDEGFTSFYDQLAEYAIMGGKDEFLSGAYNNYFRLVASGLEEPLTTHADRYQHNFAYGVGSYSKGAIFLNQLGYIIGYENLFTTIKRYYNEFKFTHPTPNDFKRVAEKVSGMQLEWYLNDWAQTTKTIDYGIDTVVSDGNSTRVQLNRIGMMPMPVEIVVDFSNGNKEVFYIPLQMMRGEKVFKDKEVVVLPDWGWASPNYEFTIDKPKEKIKSIRLNEEGLVADVDVTNDIFVVE